MVHSTINILIFSVTNIYFAVNLRFCLFLGLKALQTIFSVSLLHWKGNKYWVSC